MNQELLLLAFALLAFVFLFYGLIVLAKRKEYESARIFNGYNLFIFALFLFMLTFLIKTVKYVLLHFAEDFISGGFIYFDVVSNLILLPLIAASFFTGLLLFSEV